MNTTEKPKYEGRGIDAKALTAEIRAGVSKVYETNAWKEALIYSSKFWSYSFRNQFCIAMQYPNATRVAGFHTWKALGRSVIKGQKGIAILSPLFKGAGDTVKRTAKPATSTEASDKVQAGALCGFKVSFVFDVSQTQGKEAPEYCHPLKGRAPVGMMGDLIAYAGVLGLPVSEQALHAGLGGFVRKVGTGTGAEIVLNASNDEKQRVKTLVHELGHYLADHLEKRGQDMTIDAKELEAESASYIVGAVLGLDFSEYSFGYLASWARGFEDVEARDKALEKAGAKATSVAKTILEGLQAQADKAQA